MLSAVQQPPIVLVYGNLCDAGVDWERLRSQKAPEIAPRPKAANDNDDDGFDWELSSLAASLPLRYEYDSDVKPEQGGDAAISALPSGVSSRSDTGN